MEILSVALTPLTIEVLEVLPTLTDGALGAAVEEYSIRSKTCRN